jgi:5,5'-dehydrodivanillate O-demethylase
MLSAEDNARLTEVGPGTPMGALLRRYWMPIAAEAELTACPRKAVRLLGEDLVLYRDLGGRYGLIERHCPHRLADLAQGACEARGLRCGYHGWLFDESGRCLEQPFEDAVRPEARFRDRVRATAYPVEAREGVLWAYLGPEPRPLLPDWDAYHVPGYREVILTHLPCNWFQCQENSIDPVHFEWLHANAPASRGGAAGRAPAHLEIAFEEFEHGWVYRRRLEGAPAAHEEWTVGRVCLFPNALYVGYFQYRVPIDDENTLSVVLVNTPVPGDAPFRQERVPFWTCPLRDASGALIESHLLNQDFAAWVGQGRRADRTRERLGASDEGIILMRRKMLEQMARVAEGRDPMGVVRDPARNRAIPLPRTGRDRPPGGPDELRRTLHGIPRFYGQPQEIRDEMERIWAERAGGRAPAPPG